MSTRLQLQQMDLAALRPIAAGLGVDEHDSLQKSKLIAAILAADGFDELLTYHYLVAEVFRQKPAAHEHFYAQMTYEEFFRLSKR
ncbi:MAG: hypothetical protein ACE5E8_06460, partial [Acidimicrobiia bacterium]